MDRTARIQQIITLLSVGISIVAAQQAAAWLSFNYRNLPSWFAPAAAVVVFAAGSLLLRYCLEILLGRLRFLRRILLGDQFVEGVWFDLISQDNRPIAIGHSQIKFEGGSFHFGGEDFKLHSVEKGHYRVDLVKMAWPVLKYTYTYETAGEVVSGYGEAQFLEANSGRPRKYVGSFISLQTGSRFTFESFRVSDRQILKKFSESLDNRSVVYEYLRDLIEARLES